MSRDSALLHDGASRAAAASFALAHRAAVECVGTAFLLAAIVGSGVMGERLSHGNPALTLLANSLATGAVLIALILAFGPVSGAHLNPIVTIAEAWRGALSWAHVPSYVLAQLGGAFLGVAAAHVMFGLPLLSISGHSRAGAPQVVSELFATFGLIVVIRGASRSGISVAALAVGSYIGAAYWFTSSTSFANPAVTLARALTDTFAGIRPVDVPGFLLGQAAGGASAVVCLRWIQRGQAPTGVVDGD